MQVEWVILLFPISFAGNTANIDGAELFEGDLVKQELTLAQYIRIMFAHTLAVGPSYTVGAMVMVIHSPHIFCPQPHEAISVQIVPQFDW